MMQIGYIYTFTFLFMQVSFHFGKYINRHSKLRDTIMPAVVNHDVFMHPNSLFIIYDLEAIGDISHPSQCKIWNLAAVNYCNGMEFHAFVDPQKKEYGKPPHPDLFHVTSDFLRKNNARPFKDVGHSFFQWVVSMVGQQSRPVVFISHGNFMLDKPLLEYEFGREGVVLPHTWFFYDTLSWFRSVLKKQPSYSMKNLYQSVFREPIVRQHFAMPDVKALQRLLSHTLGCASIPDAKFLSRSLRGMYYPPYYTPLQRVKFLGNYNEMLLVQGGVQCVEDLHIILLHQCRLNVLSMQNLLMQRFHIKSDSAHKISNSVLHMLLMK